MPLAGGVVSFKTKSRGSGVVYVGWPEPGEVPGVEHTLLLFCLPIPETESKLEELQEKVGHMQPPTCYGALLFPFETTVRAELPFGYLT